MFDDFVKSLSSDLSLGKMSGGHYDFTIHQMRDMQSHQRDAHIRSMMHSQKHDYGAELRLVITEKDNLVNEEFDVWKIESYMTPGIETAKQCADEIVIRREGREMVIKSRSGGRPLGFVS